MTPASVAVTGMGVMCSIAADPDEFATALRVGHSGIGDRAGYHGQTSRAAADLTDFDFGTALADLSPPPDLHRAAVRLVGRAPLSLRASTVVALQAWRSAGLWEEPVVGERVGVIVAGHNLTAAHTDAVRPRYLDNPRYLPATYARHGLDTDHIGTISQLLGIHGEGFTVGAASASGNLALINGIRLIGLGVVDVCLVIGALTDLSDLERQGYYNLGAMAEQSGIGPFDTARAGFVPGQGAACLVLESTASAKRRGRAASARLIGYGTRLDGNAATDPDVTGEAAVMASALLDAGITADRIGYVNAHGTGSDLGDRTELAALERVWTGHSGRPLLNSTKGLTGHCLCAAGVVEAVAVIVQLRDGFAHGNAGLRTPMATGFRLPTTATMMDVEYALSNGFGFGGFNTSLVFHRTNG